MRRVKIPKGNGKFRLIYVPSEREKRELRTMLGPIVEEVARQMAPGVIHGFMPGRSPVTNAMQHRGYQHSLCLDMKDFFDTVKPEMVAKFECCSKYERMAVYKVNRDQQELAGVELPTRDGFGEVRIGQMSWFVSAAILEGRNEALVACRQRIGPLEPYFIGSNVLWERMNCFIDGAARQGLPTSPAVANLAACPMDWAITELKDDASFGHFTYTRYADDMTLSTNDYDALIRLREKIPEVVEEHGFVINPRKTHIQSAYRGRRMITGVGVDAEIHVPRAIKRRIRACKHKEATNRKAWRVARGLEQWAKMAVPKQYQEAMEQSRKDWDKNYDTYRKVFE